MVKASRDDTKAEVRLLASLMLDQTDRLADEAARQILDRVPYYANAMNFEQIRASCLDHIHSVFDPMAGLPLPQAHPDRQEAGRRRAEAGIPLAAVMEAFRTGTLYLWEELAGVALSVGVSTVGALAAASLVLTDLEHFTREVSAGYREEIAAQVRRDEQQRSSFVQALMEGRLGQTSLWEAAEVLDMNRRGPFVSVLAFVPSVGKHALPRIEQDLRTLGIRSAWRLNHDLEVGVVCLPRPAAQLTTLIDMLTERCTGRVGVSPPYTDLRATTHSMRLARIALHGAFDAQPVVVFDRNPLAIAAASAPDDVMKRLSRTALAGLAGLAPAERAVLLETLGAWFDSGGSVVKTAEALFVHRNTVRHRLRKLEERTGRSLTDPRWIAEVSLAFEIDRRLEADEVPQVPAVA